MFDEMISESLITIAWVVGAVGLVIGGITFTFAGDSFGEFVIGIGVVAILGNLLWRILCEGIIVIFSIFRTLQEVNNNIVGLNDKIERLNAVQPQQSANSVPGGSTVSSPASTPLPVRQNNPVHGWTCKSCGKLNGKLSMTCKSCGGYK